MYERVEADDLPNRIQVETFKPWNYHVTIGGTNWLGDQNSFNRPVDGRWEEMDRSLPHTSIVAITLEGSSMLWNSGPINKAFIINFYFTIIIKLYDIFHFSTLARIVCHPSGMDAGGRKGVRHTHSYTRVHTARVVRDFSWAFRGAHLRTDGEFRILFRWVIEVMWSHLGRLLKRCHILQDFKDRLEC